MLERFGAVPLPPYIRHAPDADDAERYQTVYATQPGAVAAPTAGLHFDAAMLKKIESRGAQIASAHAARRLRHLPAGAHRRGRRAPHAPASATSIPEATLEAIVGQARACRRNHVAARARKPCD